MNKLYLLVVLFLFSFLYTKPVWGAAGAFAVTTSPTPTPAPTATPSPTPTPGTFIGIAKDPLVKINDVGVLIGSGLAILLIIAAILSFIFIILGGLQWITSGGDKAGVEAARGKITNAIVGLIIVAAAWAIMVLVQQFLGINLFGGAVTIPKAYIEPSPTPIVSPTPNP